MRRFHIRPPRRLRVQFLGMATKFLIVDPDMAFAIGIKRALEGSSGYAVTPFTSGAAALEFLSENPQDVALVDLNLIDMPIGVLGRAMHEQQTSLILLASARSKDQLDGASLPNIFGTIIKPYYARQLLPLLQDALKSRSDTGTRPATKQPESKPIILSSPPPSAPIPVPKPDLAETQGMPVSADFDAALASLKPVITEPPPSADDTFRRHLAAMLPEKPATPAGLRQVLDSVDLSDEATIADVVSGKPLTDPAPLSTPPNAPEEPPERPTIAEAALDALDTIPMGEFTLDKFTQAVEKTSGVAMPEWVREPGFVQDALAAAGKDSTSTDPPPTDAVQPDPAQSTPNEAPDDVVQMAASLTQLTLGTAARATLLTREGALVAAAGDLGTATDAVVAQINTAWSAGQTGESVLAKFIQVPGLGDFLLYSSHSVEDMRLSLLFPAETPMKTMRRLARQLLDRLERPDAASAIAEPTLPDMERTLLSRPTDMRPPRSGNTGPLVVPNVAPPVSKPIEAPKTMFGVLLLPRVNAFAPEALPLVPIWLTEACLEAGLYIEGVIAQATYLTFQLGIVQDTTPGSAIRALMDATAARGGASPLFADGYFIATPNRPVTQQEIASFIAFQKTLDPYATS